MAGDEAQDSGPVVIVSSSFGVARASTADPLPETLPNPVETYPPFAGSEACTLPSELDPTRRVPESTEITILRPRVESPPSVDRLRDELERLRELMLELGHHTARLEATYERQRERVEQLERRIHARASGDARAMRVLAAALILLAITTFVVFGPLR